MIVLDASALVDVIADRPARNGVLTHLARPARPILAPRHQLAEVSSAVGRLVRAGELTDEDARRALVDAASLAQQVVGIDEPLLLRAHALRERVRVLDGLYVALAERHGCPLLTTDARLARADPPCEVLLALP